MTFRMVTLLTVAFATMIPGLARADGEDEVDHERALKLLREGRIVSLAEAMAAAQAVYPGMVVEVELEEEPEHGLVYELKLLGDDGRYREIDVDAETAEILKSEWD